MSVIILRKMDRARQAAARLEARMPRDLTRLVRHYLSPKDGDEFKFQLGDVIRVTNGLHIVSRPVRDHLGNPFYLQCEAVLQYKPFPNWSNDSSLVATCLNPEAQANIDRINEHVLTRFPRRTISDDEGLRFLSGECKTIQPGHYRLILEFKRMIITRRYIGYRFRIFKKTLIQPILG
jgi:hypothetical protein